MDNKTKTIIENHKKWLLGHGTGRRANLSWANLRGANLRGANLREANLSWANLSWANLSEANLSEANLSEANLIGANLSEANLSEANLRGADLREANLSDTNLRGADLNWADLRNAKGIFYTAFDPRGWVLVSWKHNNQIGFTAGCNSFNSKDEAIAHWGDEKYHTPEIGQNYIKVIEFHLSQWKDIS